MYGLQNKHSFTDLLTAEQRKLAERLSEIEKEDAERCSHCGGEDCICCEYYHDRQRWVEPEELFVNDFNEFESIEYEDDEFEEDES